MYKILLIILFLYYHISMVYDILLRMSHEMVYTNVPPEQDLGSG